VARSASVHPVFTAETSNFELMPRMTDYPCNISFPAFSAPSQHSTVPVEENVLNNRAVEFQGSEPDPFSIRMIPQDVAYWDVSQYLDNLYQGPGADFGFVMSVDVTESSQIEAPVSEPDLGPNVASPPAPSFLDARASPEPLEGQGLKFDDYVRKVFANRRHLHNKDVHGQNSGSSRGLKLEKAHIPPLMGDFSPFLASGNDDSIWEPENLDHVPYLPQQVYEQIADAFQKLNTTWGPYIQFAGGAFPSLAACNAFMQLYFEEFNPLFPFLHQPTFDPSASPWLLVLATISIGIRFAREPAAVECGDMMQEFLRRAFLATVCIAASLLL
jgi:Fungal specific transcription factor domain